MRTLRDIQVELRTIQRTLIAHPTNDSAEFRLAEIQYHKLKDEYEDLKNLAALNKRDGLCWEM